MTRPLEGVTVLDFSTLLPGPLATLMMVEAGADVIKVERPQSGDDMRSYAPSWGEDSATFALLNRGKESLALDLKDPSALERLQPLIERADVLVEQFRPGVMARLGLGFEHVHKINPRLIYCSISAYGQTGPKRNVAGHDINLMAESGLLSLSDAGNTAMPPTPIADIAGGSYPAIINILLALYERVRTGRGRHIDIALADNLFSLGYWALAQGWVTSSFPTSGDHLVTGASPRYRLYRTKDGGIVAAAPIETKFWANFCGLLGLADDLRDDAFDPGASAAAIEAIIASEDTATWEGRFADSDCCCTIARTLEDALADPHFRARGLFEHQIVNGRGNIIPALPVPIDRGFRAAAEKPIASPPLGEANSRLPTTSQSARPEGAR